jgi:hypothetical protein
MLTVRMEGEEEEFAKVEEDLFGLRRMPDRRIRTRLLHWNVVVRIQRDFPFLVLDFEYIKCFYY